MLSGSGLAETVSAVARMSNHSPAVLEISSHPRTIPRGDRKSTLASKKCAALDRSPVLHSARSAPNLSSTSAGIGINTSSLNLADIEEPYATDFETTPQGTRVG